MKPLNAEQVRVAVEKIFLSDEVTIDQNFLSHMKVEAVESFLERTIRLRLNSYMVGIERDRISVHRKWPTTWWDAFKDRWFFDWMLVRWPVNYTCIDIEEKRYSAVCPHINVPDDRTHFEFLRDSQDN